MKSLERKLLFYCSDKPISNTLCLDKSESHHAINVLRIKKQQNVVVCDGNGVFYEGIVTSINKGKCLVAIVSVNREVPPSVKINIAVALLKSMNRWKYLVEKFTELGGTRIIPLTSEYSQVKTLNISKQVGYAVSALKQSRQPFLPEITPVTTFLAFIKNTISGCKFVASSSDNKLADKLNLSNLEKEITFLIGPEGGFSELEIAQALTQGFVPVNLGENTLRTETAAIMMVSYARALIG